MHASKTGWHADSQAWHDLFVIYQEKKAAKAGMRAPALAASPSVEDKPMGQDRARRVAA